METQHKYPRAVTFTEPYALTISQETASRDYVATVRAGTYPITYTDIRGRECDPENAYYARVDTVTDVPERHCSSAELGGVAVAWETVPAREEVPHS